MPTSPSPAEFCSALRSPFTYKTDARVVGAWKTRSFTHLNDFIPWHSYGHLTFISARIILPNSSALDSDRLVELGDQLCVSSTTMASSTITPSSPLTGSCFCGAVTYALSAPPVLRAYCHCTQCQRLTGCPFIHTVHFPASAFSWTHDAPVDTFVNPLRPWKTRTRCHVCGVSVASHNSTTDKVSVWGPHFSRNDSGRVLSWDEVRPTAHIFYGTRLLDVEDGLGKWEGYEGKSELIR